MKYGFLLCALLLSPLAGADVYRSVNSAGEITFSDTPSPGAQRVHLPKLTTYRSAPVPRLPATVTARSPVQNSYTSFVVSSPQDQATIWDNQGIVKMTVSIEPVLDTQAGHRIQYFLDGKPQGNAELSFAHTFSGLDRGTHTLSAAVVDSNGHSVLTTSPVTIYLHHASVLHPTNPLYKGK